MEHKIITSLEGMDELEDDWEILRKSCGASIYESFAWARRWTARFAPEQLYIVVLRENGNVCAIAPFILTEQRISGIKIRKLSMIGNGEGTAELYDLEILREGNAEAVAEELIRVIDSLSWNVLQLHDLRCNEFSDILYERISAEWDTDEKVMIPCPRVELIPENDVLDSASSRTKRTVRKTFRQLSSDGRMECRCVRSPEEVRKAAEAYALQHISRWSMKGGSIYSDENIASFLQDTAENEAREGRCRVFEILIDRELASQIFCFEDGSVMRAYRIGMNPRLSEFSPGNLVSYYAMKESKEEGFSEFDFGLGSEEYKYRLGSKDRYLMRIQTKRGAVKAASMISAVPGVRYILSRSRENALKIMHE